MLNSVSVSVVYLNVLYLHI